MTVNSPLPELAEEGKIDIKPYQVSNQQLIEVIDSSIVRIVGPRQYYVADFSEDSPLRFIDSYGANPCLITTLHDHSLKRGLVAHLDVDIDVGASVEELLSHYRDSADVELAFYGGNIRPQSRELVTEATALLTAAENTKLVENRTCLTLPEPKVQSIVHDLLTGRRYDGVGTRLKYQDKVDFVGTPGKIQQIT